MFRSHAYSWHEVTFFAVASIHHNRMVVFNASAKFDKARALRAISRAVAGYEGALPDTYGMKADQLADLLNEWKAKYDRS